jgi:hypothetical protein
MQLTPDQREFLSALVWQGQTPQLGPVAGPPDARAPQAPAADPSAPPVILPPGLGPSLLGPRPEIVIALHDILDAMGHGAADQVLARLARMSDADQRAIYRDPRYRAKLDALPDGREKSPERDFKDALRKAERDGAREALLHYPGPGGDGDVYQTGISARGGRPRRSIVEARAEFDVSARLIIGVRRRERDGHRDGMLGRSHGGPATSTCGGSSTSALWRRDGDECREHRRG